MVKNGGKIDAQAEGHRAGFIAKERARFEGMMSPEFLKSAGEEGMQQLLDQSLEQYTRLSGNSTLDNLITNLRSAAWASTGSGDVLDRLFRQATAARSVRRVLARRRHALR